MLKGYDELYFAFKEAKDTDGKVDKSMDALENFKSYNGLNRKVD